MNEDTLQNIVRSDGRLPIDLFSDDVEECYQAYEKFMIDSTQDIMQKVVTVIFPSTTFDEKLQVTLESISKLINLTSFTYKGGKKDKNGQRSRGDIENLPKDMQKLTRIRYLDLSFNDVTQIPDWIFAFSELQRLLLCFCSIISVPSSMGNFINIKEIHLKENSLSTLPIEMSNLQNLERLDLSNNKFLQIPSVVGNLRSLIFLDLSENKIQGHIDLLENLSSLEILKLRDNEIESIDVKFVEMSSLKTLDLRFNNIRQIATELQKQDFVLLDGNPIGYTSPDRNSKKTSADIYNVQTYDMKYDTNCVKIKIKEGGSINLPCGITITVPKFASKSDVTINSQILADTDVNFALEDLDELLSGVLELTPSGLTFENPVKVMIPYFFERHDQQTREIVVRVMSSDGSTEDLHTITSTVDTDGFTSSIAEAFTTHFSMFAVVARIMEATTVIQEDSSKLLFSSAYPQTKLKFEEGSVTNGTKVTMKVINMDSSIVDEVSKSNTEAASCVLSVQVFPHDTVFKKPVTVRLALPDKLLGGDFNHDDLKLMKCAHDSTKWQDVTSVTPLLISAVDVSFKVQSFSKFVLVTQKICGVVRYIIRRLRTHKVQFIAVQKHMLPTQVLAQCVLEKKVCERISQLRKSGYSGEDSVTEIQDMVEGSVFKIKVIGDLQLQEFKEKLAHHIQEKIVICKFFSQYPPDKKGFSRFFIQPKEEKKCNAGFVSFFKVDEEEERDIPIHGKPTQQHLQESLKQKRKAEGDNDSPQIESHNNDVVLPIESDEFDDNNHLGDVPVVLKGNDLERTVNLSKITELDFGGLGTGMFREDNLRLLANKIGEEWREIGTYLHLPTAQLDQISANYKTMSEQIFRMLKSWSDLHRTDEDCIVQFTEALSMAGRNDLVLKVKSLYEEGKKEFHNSVKSMRLG